MAQTYRIQPEIDNHDAGRAARESLCSRIVACSTALRILRHAGASLSAEDLCCAPVVLSQLMHEECPPADAAAGGDGAAARWLVPEPWNGHLGEAPLLFIGQNPSASFQEAYPNLGEAMQRPDLHTYFETRFAGPIAEGTRVRLRGKARRRDCAKPNRFLKDILEIATRLYGRAVIPGVDYALTEGVRCKSKDAIGVHLAVGPCARRYMRETLALSPARVIVCLGAVARDALLVAFGHDRASRETLPSLAFDTVVPLSVLDGSNDHRQLLFLRHSGAFGARAALDDATVAGLKATLAPCSGCTLP